MQMTVQYVNDPKNPGAKFGNIKSTAGETVMVPVNMLPLFRGCEGQAIDVPTKPAIWGQGGDAKQVTIATAGPGASNIVQGGWQGAQRAPASQPAPQQPAPAYRPPAAADNSRHIYITGVVGRAMGSGKFTASEIMVLTQAAEEAYDRYLDPNKKSKPAPTAHPELNDELPVHMLEPDGRS